MNLAYTKHANQQATLRKITEQEIEDAIFLGTVSQGRDNRRLFIDWKTNVTVVVEHSDPNIYVVITTFRLTAWNRRFYAKTLVQASFRGIDNARSTALDTNSAKQSPNQKKDTSMTAICEHCRIAFERQIEGQTLCDACYAVETEQYLPLQLSYLPVPDEQEDVKDNSHPPVLVTVEKD
jgi:hypothetical protein